VLAKKKKKAEKAQRRFKKEMDISQWVRGCDSQSDMEVELESEEPMEMGGDKSASKDKGDRGAIMTSMEHCEPTAASISGGCDTEKRGDVPESRKHAVGKDTTVE